MYIGESEDTNVLNVESINNEALTGKKQGNRDMFTLSPNGRKQNMLEMFTKQRQDLVDRKEKVTEDETGADFEHQREAFDAEIASLDEMIAKIEAQEEESAGIYEKPKPEQQAEAQESSQLMDIAAADNEAQTISGLRIEMIGRAGVLGAAFKIQYDAEPADKAEEPAVLREETVELGNEIINTMPGIIDLVKIMNEQTQHNKPVLIQKQLLNYEKEKEADQILA